MKIHTDLFRRWPRVTQKANHDCGRAVAQSMLVYFGHDPREVKRLNCYPLDGTHPGGLGGFLRENGLETIVGNGFTLDDLRWQTRRGRPVACLVQQTLINDDGSPVTDADNQPVTVGHWITVLAVVRRRVYFHDPAGGDKSEPESEFVCRWWDNDADAHHLCRRGIAVHR